MFSSWKSFTGIMLLVMALYLGATQAVSAGVFVFNRNLSFGSIGEDVRELQRYLNSNNFLVAQSGFGSAGNETSYFGRLTQAALIKFQKAKQIVPAIGFFGPITRGVVNQENNTEIITEKEFVPQEVVVAPPTNTAPDTTIRYSIGGTISGIAGSITLQNNNGDDLIISPGDASAFTFNNKIADGETYNVTLAYDEMRHHCYFKENSGVVNGGDVTSVKIACGLSLLHNPFEFILGGGAPATAAEQFICGEDLIDSRDDQVYQTASIGGQCWMTENLNVGTKVSNGSAEPACHDLSGTSNWSCQVDNTVIEKYCYNDSDANCTTDGGLYEWAEALALPYDCNNAVAVNNGNGTYAVSCPSTGVHTVQAEQQGICPSGWHIPSFNEYQTLARNADGGCELDCVAGACSCISAGGKLKATAAHTPIAWDGTDIYNFSTLPGGRRHYAGSFVGRSTAAFLWATLPSSDFPGSSWFINLNSNSALAAAYFSVRTNGFQLRCIKD